MRKSKKDYNLNSIQDLEAKIIERTGFATTLGMINWKP